MMQAEIKIHIDQENKKVLINGDVSLKAILALLEGLDEDPNEYTIGQIEFIPDYPQVVPWNDQPWQSPPFVPNYPLQPFQPNDPYGPVFVTTSHPLGKISLSGKFDIKDFVTEEELLTHNID